MLLFLAPYPMSNYINKQKITERHMFIPSNLFCDKSIWSRNFMKSKFPPVTKAKT